MSVSLKKILQKAGLAVAALGVAVAGLVPFLSQTASAASYTQITSRSIQMSNSAPSATGVSYNVGFTTSASYTVGSVAIEICTDPFVGTACTSTGSPSPTGFNWNVGAGAAVNTSTGITSLALDSTDSTQYKLVLNRTAATVAGSVGATFTISGVTNPTQTTSFYARIYTLANTTGNTATLQDAGGVALSTANVINITAKVQESLTFCAYTTGTLCASATGTALNIGDSNGVLSDNTVDYHASSYFNVYSNAQTGVTVRLKGDTLKAGSNSIAAQTTGGACVGDSTATTVEQFGLNVTGGTGVTPTAAYLCGAGSHNLDTNGSSGTTSTFGQAIAATGGPTAESKSTVEYNAKAATTTKAGIYTAAMTFIATGAY